MIGSLAGKIVNRPSPLLLPLLILLSQVYRVIAAAHRWSHRSGLMRTYTLARPVVSIGNLAVGGGGKTPLTMWLAEALESQGKQTGVLTRGYGRAGSRNVIASSKQDWKYIGDEPALMVRKMKGLPVAVSKNRRRGGEELLKKQDIDLFILDDGFGHHALHKDLEIVLIDDVRRFGNGRLLPAGILRETVGRLRDARIIVVTKAEDIDPKFEEEIKKHTDAPVLWADFRPGGLAPVGGITGSGAETVPEGPYLGFCGIADPDSFRISLERAGIQTVKIISFPDHHPYRYSDVATITEEAIRNGARTLVTTEKDGVRWPSALSSMPCFVLAMNTIFLRGEDTLLDAVTETINKSNTNLG